MVPNASDLGAAGFRPAQAAAIRSLHARAVEALVLVDPASRRGVTSFYVPGRLEVLGKHTDYAGGRSLLCAIERGLCLAAAPRTDGRVVAIDARDGSVAAMAPGADAVCEGPPWRQYVETVVRRLARNLSPDVRGATMSFASDLPAAAGLSSSSALVVSLLLGLLSREALERHPAFRREIATLEDLATFASCVENGQAFGTLAGGHGVGTAGGSEDHVAMPCCRAGCVSHYSFCPTRLEGCASLDAAWTFVVAVSGASAEKTGAARDAYNHASRLARRLLEIWRADTGHDAATLAAALSAAPDAADRLRTAVDRATPSGDSGQALHARLTHFVEENQFVVAAAAALDRGEIAQLGTLVDRSQLAAERWLGNQVPETITLARTARELGAVAASSFGAGFGGAVWAMVDERAAADFAQQWAARYLEAFPVRSDSAHVFVTRPGPAAVRLLLHA